MVECDKEVARMKREEEGMQKEVGMNAIEVKKLEHQVWCRAHLPASPPPKHAEKREEAIVWSREAGKGLWV